MLIRLRVGSHRCSKDSRFRGRFGAIRNDRDRLVEFLAEQEDAQYGEKVEVGELEHPSSQEGQEEGVVQLGSLAAGFVTVIYSIYGRRG